MTRILADTLVFVRHFRRADPVLQSRVSADRMLAAARDRKLLNLMSLQRAVIATSGETLALIERECLYDTGCGAVDVMLQASTLLTSAALMRTDSDG